MRSIGELKDQLSDAQEAVADEERELRKVELLVEKESTAAAGLPPQTPAPTGALHVR